MNPALYRFVITLGNLYIYTRASKSPNPPATAEDRKKYEANKATSDHLATAVRRYVLVILILLYTPPLIEQYVILRSINAAFSIPPLDSFLCRYFGSHPSTSNGSLPIRMTSTFITGTFMVFTGSLTRIICYRHLGKQFTFELSSRNDDKLVTDGPYSIVRHPSYTGGIIMMNGMFLCVFGAGSWWAEYGLWGTLYGKGLGTLVIVVCANFLLLLARRAPKEDKLLRMQFGKQWDEWAKRTPYRLVPGLY